MTKKRLLQIGIVLNLSLFLPLSVSAETLTLKTGKVFYGAVEREAEQYLMFKDRETGQVQGFLKEHIQSLTEDEPVSGSILPVIASDFSSVQPEVFANARSSSVQTSNNVLRIYGTEILEENAPTDQYDFSEDSTFYVKKEKDSFREVRKAERWVTKNIKTPSFLIAFVLSVFFVYIFFFYPLYLIARKTEAPYANFAWFPILNLFLMCKIAGRPGWWMLLFFVPVVNLVILVMVWMNIAEICGKPSWLGVFILLPIINLFLQWYLAVSSRGGKKKTSRKKVAMIDEEKAAEEDEQALFNQIVPTRPQSKPKKF